MKKLLVVWGASLVAVVMVCGCSDGGATVNLEGATVQTIVSDTLVNAGETFEVSCIVLNGKNEEVDTDTMFAVVPGKNVETDGEEVTAADPGKYEVTCMVEKEDGACQGFPFSEEDADNHPDCIWDDTSETVTVTKENIASVETELSTNECASGEEVEVTCEVKDEEGNKVEWDTEVLVDPEGGVEVDGHTLKTVKSGEFEVACQAKGLPIVDETPEKLTVGVGEPVQVRATIKEDEVEAGTEVPVFCTVEDVSGNVLMELTEIDPQEGFEVDGSVIIPTKAGEYDVTCSAKKEELKELKKIPDHLKVTAGEVAGLELVPKPKKKVYAVDETVIVTGRAVDAYGNEVEGIGAVITPPAGMEKQDEKKYLFVTEGVFTFTGHLEEPYQDITGELTLYCDESGPDVLVFKPERAATLDGPADVSVEGEAHDLISDTVELEINGASVPVDKDGKFYHNVPAQHGMNILFITATDGFGNQTKIAQSFYYSVEWVDFENGDINNNVLEQALVVFLGQNFMDDGVHDPTHIDDMATLMEILLDSLSTDMFGGNLPVVDTVIPGVVDYTFNVATFDFSIAGDIGIVVYIQELSMAKPYVGINTREGGIDMTVSFQGTADDPGIYVQLLVQLTFNLTVSSTLGQNTLFTAGIAPSAVTQGSVGIETLLVETSMDINKDAGEELSISVGNLSIDPVGIQIDPLTDLDIDLGTVQFNGQDVFVLPSVDLGQIVSGLNDIVTQNILDPVINFVLPGLLDLLEPLIEQGASMLLGQVLNQFEIELPIPIPQLPGMEQTVEVTFKTKLSTVHFKDEGGELGLAAGFNAPKGVDRVILGSILRAGCNAGSYGVPTFDVAEKMELAAALDMVNELVFSIWWGTGLKLSIDSSLLGNVDLGQYGLTDLAVGTDFMLSPILDDCTAKGMVELQIGDLLVKPSFSLMGAPVAISMYVSVALDATIYGQGSEIGLEVLGITDIGTQIVSIEGDLGFLEGIMDIEDLVETVLVPMIVEQVSNLSLGSFPIPSIDLSGLLPGIPPGTTLTLGNLEINMDHGYLVIGGELM